MDKELPKSDLDVKPGKVFIRLTKSQLPGSEPFYRGTLPFRRTLTIEDIADRAREHRTTYSRETLIAVYDTMKEEIYRAIKDGFNVDFGLARTELVARGRFTSESDKFDKKRHSLQARFRASPRLNQLADSIPAATETGFFANAPGINEISISNQPHSSQSDPTLPFNSLPSGYTLPLFLHGRRLKLMGDHPSVGITLRALDTGQEYFIPPRMVFINDSNMLAFMPPLALTPGEWEVEVSTQYNPSYRLYKEPRYDCISLTVLDTTASGRGD